MGYIVGNKNLYPCGFCRGGGGPFQDCVVVIGTRFDGSNYLDGKCANDYYGGSFRDP